MPKQAPNIRNLAWGICLGMSALACIAWSAFPMLESAPLVRVGLFSASGVIMLGLVFFLPNINTRDARRLILGAAVLLRLLLWPAPVSDDVQRYLWEGKLVHSGENPYSAPASDPRWEKHRDAFWQAMNHRDRATAYPPGIQWVMAATSAIHPSLMSFKVLALIGDITALLLLFTLLTLYSAPLKWAGFYAFNPIVLIAFAAEAHFDSLMIAAMLAAMIAASRNKSSAWLWLGVAIQIKLVCIILVPLFLTRRLLPASWLLLLVLILPSLPFHSGLAEWLHGVKNFTDSGAFNAPLHTLLAAIGLSFDGVRTLSTITFCACALTICIARWRGASLIDSTLWMLGSLLVCSPIIHFWYLTWLLPLAAMRPSFAWTTLSITMGGYFIAWHTLATAGWWGYGHAVAAVIWLPCLIAGIVQHRFLPSRRKAKRTPSKPFDLAVVLPVLNAGSEVISLLGKLRAELGENTPIVVVDGGSKNDSLDHLAHGATSLIHAPRGRGNQIAAGIAATDSSWILIVHADSTPPGAWFANIQNSQTFSPDASMLVFGQRFDHTHPGTLFIEALNEMRVIFGSVAFGDQTMVIRRAALDAAGGFPAQPLMEDVEVSMRLATQGRIVYLGNEWTLSARKWNKDFGKRVGMIVRLVASYQLARLKSQAHAAAASEKMYRIYYPENR
ncbi:MAG: glycosyltransferase [Gloeobacteraceae cyanobacterium ES-bin-144]|nr:glycosyltransferase [Verrucomicrobiales bacterium]